MLSLKVCLRTIWVLFSWRVQLTCKATPMKWPADKPIGQLALPIRPLEGIPAHGLAARLSMFHAFAASEFHQTRFIFLK